MSLRNKVEVGPARTVKRFQDDPAFLARELHFYQKVPWAAPRLLDHGEDFIVLETLPCAARNLNWRPLGALRKLLTRLHDAGVNHMDVHVENVMRCPKRGPVLIDWEWATEDIGPLSYDLYGPRKSGRMMPKEKRGPEMWIGANHPKSVKRKWNTPKRKRR